MRRKVLLAMAVILTMFFLVGCGHSHTYGDWSIVTEPTTTEVGSAERLCSTCEEKEVVEVPVLTDDIWTVIVVDATCEAEGSKTYTSVYGEVVVRLAVADHNYGEWTLVTEPTKTEVGSAERVCSVCDDKEVVEVPVLTDDIWTVTVVDATCEAEGSETYTSVYGEVVVRLAIADHNYGEWTLVTEPTETEVGSAERVCSVCDDKEVVEVPVLTDDIWSVTVVDATYNKPGVKTYSSIYGAVEFTTTKLLAPYDNKTYSSFAIDARYEEIAYKNGVVSATTSWNTASIELDGNGAGLSSAFPFNGNMEVTMVDHLTGRVNIKITPYNIDEETGEITLRPNDAVNVIGYVDMVTGIILRTHNSTYNYFHVLTPFETGVTADKVKSSSWDNAVAVQYTYNEETYSFFTYNERVYFGVEFVDENGLPVVAEDCYQSPYLYVFDNNGELIDGFVYNGEKLVPVDGYEGTYTVATDELVISGYGDVTYKGVLGTYEIAPSGSDYTLGIYVDGFYDEVILDTENMTYTITRPMVNITLVGGEYAEDEDFSANKNIELVLPELTHEKQTFKGWFYDEACLQPVEDNYVPTEDITFYALWAPKVTIYLNDVVEGDATILYLGEGDIIGNYLPKYTIDLVGQRVFKGWYMDSDFNTSLPEEATLYLEDSGFTIYAKWDILPAYYGTYKGTELWGQSSGNSSTRELTIDENGNMSGVKNGIIVSYDPLTQLVTWKDNESSTLLKYFWFDAEVDVIAGLYRDNEIGYDFYILGKYQTTNKMDAHYGVKAPVEPGSSNFNYYARFVNIMTKDGLRSIFLYNNHIYSNVIIEDTSALPLTVNDIKDSKSVVVRDATTNEMIIGLASLGTSFSINSETVVLDTYFGIYDNGEEQVILDGSGNITIGEKTGRYKKAESAPYDFDVYLENDSEYYQLTLDDTSYTIIKPLALVNFEVGADHNPIASQEYNINVAATLPNGEDEGWVFNGWFLDQNFTNPVATPFIPTEPTTIYAKYSVPAIVTIVYNNGEDNDQVIYSVGDITEIPMPVYTKHAFQGWYITDTFEEGSEWVSGQEILESVIIYAKWEIAPPYNNKYALTEIEINNENETDTSYVYTWASASAIADIDPYGNAPGGGYPINGGDVSITEYDEVTGKLLFNVGTKVRRGWIDPVTGIMIVNIAEGVDTELSEVYFCNPFEQVRIVNQISSSYWNFGKTRTIQYTFEENTYSIFIFNDEVYFNVTFKDVEGNDVLGVDCYLSDTLYVRDANGTLIGKFGYDGTTMQFLDGYEGVYSNGEDTLELNGVYGVKLNGAEGEYYQISSLEDTFDVYVDGICYEVVVDKDNYTYTIEIPMVTIEFDNDSKGDIESTNVNRNIVIDLPLPTHDEYVFRGWYKEATFETLVDNNYIPTINETLYAKWDLKVTLTVVYGNGMEVVVLEYGVGDLTEPIVPGFTNGKVFDGWYLDDSYSIPYSLDAIVENTIIYCKWMDAIPLYGTYQGTEIWGGAAKGGTTYGGTYSKAIDVSPTGTTTGDKNGQIEDYDEETGSFKLRTGISTYYYGVFDVDTGLLVYNYSSNKDTLGNDMFIYLAGSTSVNGYDGSHWNSGTTRLVTLVIEGHSRTSMNLFIYNDKLYTDVTWTSTDGDLTARDAWNSNQLTLLDSDGNMIAEFVKDADNGLVEVL